MSYLNVVKDIFVELQKQVNHRSLKEKYFSCKDTSFTRRRSMPLSELVAFLLQRSTNGLDIKLDKWFSKWMPEGTSPVSRQAISKARQLLPEEIFHDFLRLSAILRSLVLYGAMIPSRITSFNTSYSNEALAPAIRVLKCDFMHPKSFKVSSVVGSCKSVPSIAYT